MILNFDRGYGQSAEQMVQSLMESTQMAFDTLERKLGLSEGSLIDDDGNVITDKIEANNVIADKIEANNVITDKIEANNVSINGIPIKGCHKIRTSKTGDEGTYTYDSIDWYMLATQTVYLEEKLSEQQNGVILVWSFYDNGAQNYNWNFTVVPKTFVADNPSVGGMTAFMVNNTAFGYVAAKYLYVYDNRIVGNENNNTTGTGTSGIKYANNKFVLRWVYGF